MALRGSADLNLRIARLDEGPSSCRSLQPPSAREPSWSWRLSQSGYIQRGRSLVHRSGSPARSKASGNLAGNATVAHRRRLRAIAAAASAATTSEHIQVRLSTGGRSLRPRFRAPQLEGFRVLSCLSTASIESSGARGTGLPQEADVDLLGPSDAGRTEQVRRTWR